MDAGAILLYVSAATLITVKGVVTGSRPGGDLMQAAAWLFTAVVAGLPNKSIAYDLDISPRTVEVHRANVMAKMKAKSLPHLVRMALAAGFGPS